MRMWMVDPCILCHRHLGGEYRELLMFAGALRKCKKITGYIRNNCLEPRSLVSRFRAIRNEKLRRGHHPNFTPEDLIGVDISYLPVREQTYRIDADASLKDLLARCPKCRERWAARRSK
jgi:hypothetical protein